MPLGILVSARCTTRRGWVPHSDEVGTSCTGSHFFLHLHSHLGPRPCESHSGYPSAHLLQKGKRASSHAVTHPVMYESSHLPTQTVAELSNGGVSCDMEMNGTRLLSSAPKPAPNSHLQPIQRWDEVAEPPAPADTLVG